MKCREVELAEALREFVDMGLFGDDRRHELLAAVRRAAVLLEEGVERTHAPGAGLDEATVRVVMAAAVASRPCMFLKGYMPKEWGINDPADPTALDDDLVAEVIGRLGAGTPFQPMRPLERLLISVMTTDRRGRAPSVPGDQRLLGDRPLPGSSVSAVTNLPSKPMILTLGTRIVRPPPTRSPLARWRSCFANSTSCL
jgi:hypothetical protein